MAISEADVFTPEQMFTERTANNVCNLRTNEESHRAVVPTWERYTLSVEEAAAYFRIGENKLRKIINEDHDASFILWNGNRPQIKRKIFEKLIDGLNVI